MTNVVNIVTSVGTENMCMVYLVALIQQNANIIVVCKLTPLLSTEMRDTLFILLESCTFYVGIFARYYKC